MEILEGDKTYLRIDGNDEDEQIELFRTAAIAYAEEQTGKAYNAAQPLWELLIKKYMARWYTHRGDNLPSSMAQEDPSIEMIMQHIALCSDYGPVGGGGS